jgi:hypothetical protein
MTAADAACATAPAEPFVVRLAGAWWATDGACLIREGQPLPELDPERGDDWPGWLGAHDVSTARLAKVLAPPRGAAIAPRTRIVVHPRFGELLCRAEHLDVVRDYQSRVIRCWAGGEVFACIAVMRPDAADGVPLRSVLAGGPAGGTP